MTRCQNALLCRRVKENREIHFYIRVYIIVFTDDNLKAFSKYNFF